MKEKLSSPSDLTIQQAGIEDDFVTGLQAWVDEATAPEGEREKRVEAMRRMIEARSNGSSSLSLASLRLSSIPEQIGNLTTLTSLDLRQNKLTKLPESIGSLNALTSLHLSLNQQLTTLPEWIGGLNALTSLELVASGLTKLPESIGGLKALTSLNLFGNQLTKLPESIGGLNALTSLDLFGNQLTKLPESIGGLKALTSLDLRHNQLNPSPTLLDRLSELETRGCQILYPDNITLELRVDRAKSRLKQVARTLSLAGLDPKSNLNKLNPEIINEVIKFTDVHQLSEAEKEKVREAAEEDVKQTKMYEKYVEANLTTDNKKSETEVVKNVEEEYKSDSDELPSEKDIESEEKYKSKSSKDRGAAAEEDEKTAAAITEASASREGADGQRVDTTARRTFVGRVYDSLSSIKFPKTSMFTTKTPAQSLKNKENDKSDPSRK